jgi:hypothetical protein
VAGGSTLSLAVPVLHCQYHSLLRWQLKPDTQQWPCRVATKGSRGQYNGRGCSGSAFKYYKTGKASAALSDSLGYKTTSQLEPVAHQLHLRHMPDARQQSKPFCFSGTASWQWSCAHYKCQLLATAHTREVSIPAGSRSPHLPHGVCCAHHTCQLLTNTAARTRDAIGVCAGYRYTTISSPPTRHLCTCRQAACSQILCRRTHSNPAGWWCRHRS